MKIAKLLSFDLQGTLSESAFSDEFWMDLLPNLYAKKNQISFNQAKEHLEKEYQSIGKYHELFYNHRLRLNAILPQWEFDDIIQQLSNKPKIDLGVLQIIKNIPKNIPIIIFSATTRDFIDLELGDIKHYFHQTYSAIDDFQTPGKPPVLFQKIANLMGINPKDCLHIGDCLEMDYENAAKAGWQSYHLNRKDSRNETLRGLKQAVDHFLQYGLI